jgi:hypothetical protein
VLPTDNDRRRQRKRDGHFTTPRARREPALDEAAEKQLFPEGGQYHCRDADCRQLHGGGLRFGKPDERMLLGRLMEQELEQVTREQIHRDNEGTYQQPSDKSQDTVLEASDQGQAELIRPAPAAEIQGQ